MHDWGGVGLAFAQRFPERIERLVLIASVPFLPGYRWHRVARVWRARGAGEMFMGMSTKWAAKRLMPEQVAEEAWRHFDQGTQRAILRLYRSAPEEVLVAAGRDLGGSRARRSSSGERTTRTSPTSSRGDTPKPSAARRRSSCWKEATGSGSTGPS